MSDVLGRTAATIAPLPVPTVDGDVLRVLGFPVNSSSDTVALEMLRQTMAGEPVVIEIVAGHVLVSELAQAIQKARATVVCIADLPPSAPSRTRYIVKKLRAAVPNVAIVVGRWAPAGLSVDDPKTLTDAGANHVGSTMLETRNRLREYAVVPGVVPPAGTPADAVLAAQ
jgi:hypothetical protein